MTKVAKHAPGFVSHKNQKGQAKVKKAKTKQIAEGKKRRAESIAKGLR